MTDLARLGLRVESQEAEVAEDRLDGLAMAADRAEHGVDQLALAARRGQGAMGSMNRALVQQQAALRASQSAMGLTAAEGLNLSRQFTDIGVSAAMGMNPLMILIQQGPQIGDVFQTASMRGVGFSAVLRQIAGMAGNLISRLGPLLVITGAVGGAFALMNRAITRDAADAADSLGLTAEQVRQLEEDGVKLGVTLGDVLTGIRRTAGDMLNDAFGTQVASAMERWNNFLDELGRNTMNEVRAIAGFFGGAFEVIRTIWARLPAVLGDAAATAANAIIRAMEAMLNRARDGVNALLPVLRALRNAFPGAQGFGLLPESIGPISLGGVGNPNQGAMLDALGTVPGAWRRGYEMGVAGAEGVAQAVRENTLAARDDRVQAALEEQAAREARARGGRDRASDATREMERALDQAQRFLASLQDETAQIGLNAIEVRMRQIAEEAAKAAVYSEDLARQITAAGAAWRDRTLAFELQQEITAITDMTRAFEDEARMLELERDLIGASNVERARQLAMLQAELDLRRQAEELFRRTGQEVDLVNTPEGQRMIEQAGRAAAMGMENANLERFHDRLADTFSSALRMAAEGDWQGVLQMVLDRVLNNSFDQLGRMLADMVMSRGGGGGFGFDMGSVLKNLPKFSTGGSILPSGTGSADSQLVAFWKQPRERVDIYGPGQGGGRQRVEVVVTADREGLRAYVRDEAADVAGPMVVEGGLRAAQGGARMAAESANRTRYYLKGAN